jgi:hypothetical protein
MNAAVHLSANVVATSLREDAGTNSNTTFPPTSLSNGTASITINSYTGPTSAGASGTPGLTLAATLTESTSDDTSDITYIFQLTQPQPYTFTVTGTGNPVYLSGPTEALPGTTGTLAAGSYNLSSDSAVNSTRSFSLIISAVPEPAAFSLVAFAGIALLQRRQVSS